MTERQFKPILRCGHCGQRGPMEIVTTHSPVKQINDDLGASPSQGSRLVYELLSCPACQGVTLTSYHSCRTSSGFTEMDFELLYPDLHGRFQIAKSIKNTRFRMDENARAVMRRRLQNIHECNQLGRR